MLNIFTQNFVYFREIYLKTLDINIEFVKSLLEAVNMVKTELSPHTTPTTDQETFFSTILNSLSPTERDKSVTGHL